MRTSRALLAAVLAVGLVLAGCTDGEPDGDGTGVSRPIGSEPLGDDEVTLHLVDPPELPPELAGAEVTTSELRAPDLTERHTVEVVDVPSDTTSLEGPLIDGALLRVPEGVTVEVASEVGTVPLVAAEDAAGALGEITSSCAAPCEVQGPALVAPSDWITGIGAEPGWLLLVPSPIG